ncbi:MAG TPA: serine hydrolase domain-containing protein [Anaeromyxobacteraceae bacterium]|nr:serine hydrolase domain-containing protein [Anaeromyxobacteraceae bacterium]
MTAVLAGVSSALEAGRREGIAPALSAAVRVRGALVHASWHGEIPAPGPRPLRDGDLFDVASLTKPVATGALAAQLAAEGRLELDAPVAARLPAFAAAGKERVTVRQLLAHASGLPAWRPWFERAAADPVAGAAFLPPEGRPRGAALRAALGRGKEIVRACACAEPLEAAPGARARYGDPGFIALGLLLEEILGEPLSRAAERRVFAPLGLTSTFFLDGLDPEGAAARAGARAFAPARWSAARREAIQGAVDDDNAWAMGGASGHAGVFSTATEIAALGQDWLEALAGRPSVVPARVAEAFVRRDPTPGSGRALGWDTPTGETSLGTRLGRGPLGAVGHLGFTGCSLWIDRDAEVVCALLTNHCHPAGIDAERIRGFRRRFHDAVAEEMGIG